MTHVLHVMLDGTLQFLLILAMITGTFVIPTASLVSVLACYAGRFGIAALAFMGGWAQATLILFLAQILKTVRAA